MASPHSPSPEVVEALVKRKGRNGMWLEIEVSEAEAIAELVEPLIRKQLLSGSRPERSKRWRAGRKLGRTLYEQIGMDPSDDDRFLGIMETPELATAVLEAVGWAAEPETTTHGSAPFEAKAPRRWLWQADGPYRGLQGAPLPDDGEELMPVSEYRELEQALSDLDDAIDAYLEDSRQGIGDPATLAAAQERIVSRARFSIALPEGEERG